VFQKDKILRILNEENKQAVEQLFNDINEKFPEFQVTPLSP